jgi:putative endonuclease
LARSAGPPKEMSTLSVLLILQRPAQRAHPVNFMYYVYILFSQKDKQLYIGYTPDIKERIIKHQKGFVEATKFRRPLKLIHCESYLQMSDAKRREIFLKGGKGHNELKIQLKGILQRLGYKNLKPN